MKLQLHVQFLDDRIVPSAVQLTDDPTAAHPGSTAQTLDTAVAVDCGCPGTAIASLLLEYNALEQENANLMAAMAARSALITATKKDFDKLTAEHDTARRDGDFNGAAQILIKMTAAAVVINTLTAQNILDGRQLEANRDRQVEILKQILELEQAPIPYYCVAEL